MDARQILDTLEAALPQDYRQQAQHYFHQAWYASKQKKHLTASNLYLNVIDIMRKLPTLSVSDSLSLMDTYYRLGNCYFNMNRYDIAAVHYQNALSVMAELHNKHLDSFPGNLYRDAIELNFNLADAKLHLGKNDEAELAYEEAIRVFQHIEPKTEKEKALGDVRFNFRAFREFFEKRTSSEDYLASAEYRENNQRLEQLNNEAVIFQSMGTLSLTPSPQPSHVVTNSIFSPYNTISNSNLEQKDEMDMDDDKLYTP